MIFAPLLVIARVLDPFFLWLEAQLSALFREPVVTAPKATPTAPGAAQPGIFEKLVPWLPGLLINILLAVVGIAVVLAVVGFLVLYLERVRKTGLRNEAEEEGTERITAGGGILERGARALRRSPRDDGGTRRVTRGLPRGAGGRMSEHLHPPAGVVSTNRRMEE